MMPVFRRRYQDGLDGLVLQQLPVIPIRLAWLSAFEAAESPFQIRLIDVANRAHPDGRIFLEYRHDERAASPGADQS